MKLEDIPNVNQLKYPERISVAISKRAWEGITKLEKLGKDRSEFLRMAIDKALKEVGHESA